VIVGREDIEMTDQSFNVANELLEKARFHGTFGALAFAPGIALIGLAFLAGEHPVSLLVVLIPMVLAPLLALYWTVLRFFRAKVAKAALLILCVGTGVGAFVVGTHFWGSVPGVTLGAVFPYLYSAIYSRDMLKLDQALTDQQVAELNTQA